MRDGTNADRERRGKPTVTSTSVSIPVLERKWIDIETQRAHDQKCFRVSNAITQLLQHDQSVPRGSDGAIHYNDIIEECRRKKFDRRFAMVASRLEIKTGQIITINSCTFEQFKDIQEKVPLILRCKTMYCDRKDLPSTSTKSGTRTS